MSAVLYSVQLIWAHNCIGHETPNWPFTFWNSSNGTKVTASSLLRSAVLFSFQLIWDHCWISLERVPQIDPSQIEIISYRELNQHKIFTKPYQTKPNQIWTFLWGGNLIVSNFYLWYFLFHALLDIFLSFFEVKILWLQFWGTQSKISKIFKTTSDSRHFFLHFLFSEEKNLRGHEKRYGSLKRLCSESHNFFSFNLRRLSFGDQ